MMLEGEKMKLRDTQIDHQSSTMEAKKATTTDALDHIVFGRLVVFFSVSNLS